MSKKTFLDSVWFHVVACLISIYFFLNYTYIMIETKEFKFQGIIWLVMAALWIYRTLKLYMSSKNNNS